MKFLSTCYPPLTNSKTPNQTHKNVALNTPRQLKNNDKSWTQCFISSCINDQGLSSGGNGAGVNYPLYQFNNPNYKEELQKLSVGYGVPLSLCYGKELFENLNILQVWDEVLNHLARWRETLPDLPSLNFDENPSESFEEIKDLAPSVYRKLLDNDGIFNLVLILFPEQKVLKRLAEHFRQQQQNKTIYQQLVSKLEERLSSKENHQKTLS